MNIPVWTCCKSTENLPWQNSQLVRVSLWWGLCIGQVLCPSNPMPGRRTCIWKAQHFCSSSLLHWLLDSLTRKPLNYCQWREGFLQWFQGLQDTRRWFRAPLLPLCWTYPRIKPLMGMYSYAFHLWRVKGVLWKAFCDTLIIVFRMILEHFHKKRSFHSQCSVGFFFCDGW